MNSSVCLTISADLGCGVSGQNPLTSNPDAFFKINERERYLTLSRHTHEMVNRFVHIWHIIVACPITTKLTGGNGAQRNGPPDAAFCQGLSSCNHSYGYISLFVALINIAMSFDNLFQRIASIYDRF